MNRSPHTGEYPPEVSQLIGSSKRTQMPNSVFMSGGGHVADSCDNDAFWVTVILEDVSPTDSDQDIMQYVADQIKAANVITGSSSLSRVGPRCISIGLPLNRVSRHYLGLLEHAETLADWWLEQIRAGTVYLDREHIF
ncbi:uncharacterized protein N7529_000074 [Penicillium soppii]|uniref:uncharacterized protein n=1 Tax=Penicillium soppii TaxID=69789 RepID=UPI0025473B6B|nr:uncharacterized protein N7529_000074 [Penicillium soppii]KAJ5881402.1 hypothetical protein N7529_000074 [Penicillium soppii]